VYSNNGIRVLAPSIIGDFFAPFIYPLRLSVGNSKLKINLMPRQTQLTKGDTIEFLVWPPTGNGSRTSAKNPRAGPGRPK
jgi:hypothetical protein